MFTLVVAPNAYGPPEPITPPVELVKVQETMSCQPEPLIVTIKVPLPDPPPDPVPAVAEPLSIPEAPSQIIISLPASTTGLEHGGVGQLIT